MNLRTWARFLIAVSFWVSGLVETLGATGLVVQMSPDGRWGSGTHTLAISGPLQLVGAAILASGRKTRWALIILGCYLCMVSAFGNLPLIFNASSNVRGSALAGLLSNLAVIGGSLFWLHSERTPVASREQPSLSMAYPGRVSLATLLFCMAAMGGVLYWLHSGRVPNAHRPKPVVPVTNQLPAAPLKLLV